MTPQMVIDRISQDLETLRRLVGASPDAVDAGNETPNFTLKSSYTKAGADAAKREIEAAFEAGQIDYDKKRGLKMLVTKRTRGWSPVKQR